MQEIFELGFDSVSWRFEGQSRDWKLILAEVSLSNTINITAVSHMPLSACI